MADDKLYEQRATTGLVLSSNRNRSEARGGEPSGEPASLREHLTYRMGDRVHSGKSEIHDKIEKLKKKRGRDEADKQRQQAADTGDTVLEGSGLAYRPKTQETKAAFEQLLSFVSSQLGDQPASILYGFVDEVLATLKSEGKDYEKKKSIDSLLSKKLADEVFSRLLDISRRLTDYRVGANDGDAAGMETDEMGVAVVIEEEDSDDDEETLVVQDGTGEDEMTAMDELLAVGADTEDTNMDAGAADATTGLILTSAGANGSDEAGGVKGLTAGDVDAYWLQREVAKLIKDDPKRAHEIAEEALTILDNEDRRECENQLVVLLDYDKFDFIRLLLENRATIVTATRWHRCTSDTDRALLEAQCAGNGEMSAVLRRLKGEAMQDDDDDHAASRKKGSAKSKAAGKGGDEEMSDTSAAVGSTAAALPEWAIRPPPAQQGTVDLDQLSFREGGHLMTNTKCKLPPGSYRTQKKGYEEVHVPAQKQKPIGDDEKMIRISSLPEYAHAAFKGMESLNRVQSHVYPTAFKSPENMLVCAPTGAGKTNIAMLCVLQELGQHIIDAKAMEFDLSAFKIVYIAPMKALVAEITANFANRLRPYGMQVRELTGDAQLTKQQIEDTQMIVTTPEKWDIVTRKSGDRTYTQLVRLVIVDEIHLLHDDRGPVLESIITRTIRQVEATQEMTRIVGLSATLPNFKDVAAFLRVHPRTGLFEFDNSYRPCPLAQTYIGITERKATKRFALMNDICYDIVREHAGKNQMIIFVHARKETAKTARTLRDMALDRDELGRFLREDSAAREILQTEAEHAKNDDLKELLPYGFAIHHAGMQRVDRELVEDLFADGSIQVLVSTATLAWGVNLPAHTVIIKGTQIYNPERGQWCELSHMDVMQMMGRAGRPQYDTYGEGYIITTHTELQFYLSLLNRQLPVESQLIAQLADALNGEIVLGSIQTLEEAVQWLGYTYLYVRMRQNPQLYGISAAEYRDCRTDSQRERLFLERRIALIHAAATLLDRHRLVQYDKRSGRLLATDLGRVASYYYVSYRSMQVYNEHLKPLMNDIDVFRLFALSNEFRNMVVRQEEKMELAKLAERVPVPIKESLDEPTAKVNVLLQAYISRLQLDGFALMADMTYITQSASRLVRALFEIALARKWASLAERLLALARMISRRMWSIQTPLRQYGRIPEDILRRLEKKDFPFERLFDLQPEELGELVRYPKLGRDLYRYVHNFPRLEIAAHIQPITRSVLRVELTLTPDFLYNMEKIHGPAELFWVLVTDCDGDVLLHSETFVLSHHHAPSNAQEAEHPEQFEHVLNFTVPIQEPLPPQYFVRVLSDRWIGGDAILPISFRHLLLPEKYPPHTELLDLQPLQVSALANVDYERLFPKPMRYFPPVTTQVFGSVYQHTGESVFIGTSVAAVRHQCAELAILGGHRDFGSDLHLVYMNPLDDVLDYLHQRWAKMFTFESDDVADLAVVRLTGDTTSDVKNATRANIVLATPEQWDQLSRRWRQRRAVQQVQVFVADELQHIGQQRGPTMEIVCSRMRYVSKQLAAMKSQESGEEVKDTVRIIGLSCSLANGRDIAEWLGVAGAHTFNFHPSVRGPTPVEIRLTGFDQHYQDQRITSMVRPCFLALQRYFAKVEDDVDDNLQAILFVPSRRHARLTAIDLVTYSAAEHARREALQRQHGGDKSAGREGLYMFMGAGLAVPEDEEAAHPLQKYIDLCRERALKQTLECGIGYLHEGMNREEKEVVVTLYREKLIRLLVCVQPECYRIQHLEAPLVFVLDTQTYRGASSERFADYPLTDVLQMVNMAALNADGTHGDSAAHGQSDAAGGARGIVHLYCHSAKKEYYKRFLHDSFPIESHVDHYLADHVNAEIVTKTIESKQDAVDYLTWTFLYRRLVKNPNYYNLAGITHRHVSDALSELVEQTIEDLNEAKCIKVVDDMDVEALNLGMIAAYYYTTYTTLEIYAQSVTAKTKLRGLLEILSASSEFQDLVIRPREEKQLERIGKHARVKINAARFNTAAAKVNVLLQSQIDRMNVAPDLQYDRSKLVSQSLRLLQAMVDVISSHSWLLPALTAMELSQMLVQGCWQSDSALLQIPHVDRDVVEALKGKGVETVYELIDMEDDDRLEALKSLSQKQLEDVAVFCNTYPNIEVNYQVLNAANDDDDDDDDDDEKESRVYEVHAGTPVDIGIQIERELDLDEDELEEMDAADVAEHARSLSLVRSSVIADRSREQQWWVLVGSPSRNKLFAIKRVGVLHKQQVRLQFELPETSEHRIGDVQDLTLYVMSDSYLGCDQDFALKLKLLPPAESGSEDESGSEMED